MIKITFMGAGSTVFAKNVLGDCIMTPSIENQEIWLYDIDPVRLEDSNRMLSNILKNSGRTDIKIFATLDRAAALAGAKYVVNAIQVGGYDPCTITDFEIPKKYGLRQTIADTLGIGGIFRALRTIPVMMDFANDMSRLCPDALFINYTNPMAMLSGYIQQHTSIQTIGLCHSVQGCIPSLFKCIGMEDQIDKVKWESAGINHQGWLLKVTDFAGNDLDPEITRRSRDPQYAEARKNNQVRLEIMNRFGYYVTESSEHFSEYCPWFIKDKYPELIDRFNIPLDEYPRRCINQIEGWKKMREELTNDANLEHKKSKEYAAYIIEAMETDKPYRVHGNVLNTETMLEAQREPEKHQNLQIRVCGWNEYFVRMNGAMQDTFIAQLTEV